MQIIIHQILNNIYQDKQDHIENNIINHMIILADQFYYCVQHPEFKNIHLVEIEDHLR